MFSKDNANNKTFLTEKINSNTAISPSKTFGYIRVSTKEQEPERQINEISKYVKCDRDIFIDKISGTVNANNRYNYTAMKNAMRAGDTLYIHELDRLGRSKSDILNELRDLKNKGITVRILDIPTTCNELLIKDNAILELINNLLIEVLSTMAEAEIKKIKKRQQEGIQAAKERGARFGRPPITFPSNFSEIYKQWKNKEIRAVDAMKELNLKRTSFYKLVKQYELL